MVKRKENNSIKKFSILETLSEETESIKGLKLDSEKLSNYNQKEQSNKFFLSTKKLGKLIFNSMKLIFKYLKIGIVTNLENLTVLSKRSFKFLFNKSSTFEEKYEETVDHLYTKYNSEIEKKIKDVPNTLNSHKIFLSRVKKAMEGRLKFKNIEVESEEVFEGKLGTNIVEASSLIISEIMSELNERKMGDKIFSIKLTIVKKNKHLDLNYKLIMNGRSDAWLNAFFSKVYPSLCHRKIFKLCEANFEKVSNVTVDKHYFSTNLRYDLLLMTSKNFSEVFLPKETPPDIGEITGY